MSGIAQFFLLIFVAFIVLFFGFILKYYIIRELKKEYKKKKQDEGFELVEKLHQDIKKYDYLRMKSKQNDEMEKLIREIEVDISLLKSFIDDLG